MKCSIISFLFTVSTIIILLSCGCKKVDSLSALPKTVRIAIQPKNSILNVNKKWRPLMSYLSEKTGYRFELISSLSYGSFIASIEGVNVDFSIQNGLLYLLLVKTKGAIPLVKVANKEGPLGMRGTIITHKDNTSLQKLTMPDQLFMLKGKKIAISSKYAVTGYLAQAVLCKENGVDPNKDLNHIIVGKEKEVLDAVLSRSVDAAFISEETLQEHRSEFPEGVIVVLLTTKYYPQWCLTSFKTTDPELSVKVKSAIMELNNGDEKSRQILSECGVSGFIETSPEEYKIIEKDAQLISMPY